MKQSSPFQLTMAAVVAAVTLLGVSPVPPSAEEYYAQAVARMRAHPAPAFATYDALVSGLQCDVGAKGELNCSLSLGKAPQRSSPLTVALRQSDGRVALAQRGRAAVLGDSTFLNATWPGVDEIIRRGFTGKRDAEPAPAPSPAADAALPVIATVSAFAADRYRAYDEGPTICSTGRPGHAVHLVARRDPMEYPLTEATVDVGTGDLCAVRFNARVEGPASLVGATGSARLDLERVGGYDVVSDEHFDVDLRAVGIAVKHFGIDIDYSNFAFPKAIDPGTFATSSR
jgi:hypothetical protein